MRQTKTGDETDQDWRLAMRQTKTGSNKEREEEGRPFDPGQDNNNVTLHEVTRQALSC